MAKDTKQEDTKQEDAKQEDTKREDTKREDTKRYFIVNPAGAIHEVTRSHAQTRLKLGGGWRMATAAEIKAYHGVKEQRFDKPIAKPFSPTLEVEDTE